MKWYLKCLRQYADFSGRARRKEYWMFVLFYFIFMITAIIIDSFISVIREFRQPAMICYLTLIFAMVLPFLAVTVRRLQDTGRSGWWILINLIPVAGSIWMLVLLLQDSQNGDNLYGTNPKISPQKPDKKAQITSVAITIIIAACWLLSINIMFVSSFHVINIPHNIAYIVSSLLLLMTGIMLFQSRSYRSVDKIRSRISVPLIFYGAIISFLLIWNTISYFAIDNLPYLLQNIVILFFAVTLAMSNRKLLKTASVILTVIVCITIMNDVILNISWEGMDINRPAVSKVLSLIQLYPISLILLAGLFMPRKKDMEETTAQPQNQTATQPQPAATATQKSSTEKTYYERDNRGMRVETMQQSMAYWLGERMQSARKDPFTYYVFTNADDAKNAMLDLPFIHLAADSGKIVCDELFRFGYFAVTNNGVFTGEYDAFVAGADFTLNLWEITNEIFTKHNGKRKNDLKPEERVGKTTPTVAGNAKNAKFVRENRDATSVWIVYNAPCKADAVAFLAEQTITRPLYYVVVETPEGNFGKDKDGFYQE
ncbi:MAG: DUF805 domain-containing protein [Tannerella sp.]|jgi:uncharacterized membrane protein YhaH (DUF805 family)|nr:DUF805 domain-containing protein [Tannerella sp.]